MDQYILKMTNIEKKYNANSVLKGMNFYLKEKSIHALIGTNGAGKSTLMNILANNEKKDSGTIEIKRKYNDIAFIHQELALINDLTITENMFLGRELRNGLFLDTENMKKKTIEILEKMNISIDPNTLVGELSSSYKQIVEIGKALLTNSKVLIMDEPTASLSEPEIKIILEIMNSLKNSGVSIIFITHKLKEIISICDEFTVMRDGKTIITRKIDEAVSEETIINYMLGTDISSEVKIDLCKKDKIVLETVNFTKDKQFQDINFKLFKGEIVGITGLVGDGRSELFSTIYGANGKYSGDILIDGIKRKITKTSHAKKYGIAYVSKDRKENGIIKDLSIWENLTISILGDKRKNILLDETSLNKLVDTYVESLNVKVSDTSILITSLSGGNQQKILLARALSQNPKIIIMDNPTQGVDVGAKFEIYNIISNLAKKGVSFVILSDEIDEILRISHRIYVMNKGNLIDEFSHENANENNIMLAATGGSTK